MGEGYTGLTCSIFATDHDSILISKFKVKKKKLGSEVCYSGKSMGFEISQSWV